MQIVTASDTHNYHKDIKDLPEGDIFVHSGDLTMSGSLREIVNALDWLASLKNKFKEVIFVFGNHDFLPEQNPSLVDSLVKERKIINLNNTSISIEGIKFYGSPITPTFGDWAFMKDRGFKIKKYWDLIPLDTDILITHGPAYKILDYVPYSHEHVGCYDLLERIKKVKPKYHIFGHIHDGYGIKEHEWEDYSYLDNSENLIFGTKKTIFVNASLLNEDYELVNKPQIIKI